MAADTTNVKPLSGKSLMKAVIFIVLLFVAWLCSVFSNNDETVKNKNARDTLKWISLALSGFCGVWFIIGVIRLLFEKDKDASTDNTTEPILVRDGGT